MDDEVINISSSESEEERSSKRTRVSSVRKSSHEQGNGRMFGERGRNRSQIQQSNAEHGGDDCDESWRLAQMKQDLQQAAAIASSRFAMLANLRQPEPPSYAASTSRDNRAIELSVTDSDIILGIHAYAGRGSTQRRDAYSDVQMEEETRNAIRERLLQKAQPMVDSYAGHNRSLEAQRTSRQVENVIDEMLRSDSDDWRTKQHRRTAEQVDNVVDELLHRRQIPHAFEGAGETSRRERVRPRVQDGVDEVQRNDSNGWRRSGPQRIAEQLDDVMDELLHREHRSDVSDHVDNVINEFLLSKRASNGHSSAKQPARGPRSALAVANSGQASSEAPTPMVKISRVQVPTLLAGTITTVNVDSLNSNGANNSSSSNSNACGAQRRQPAAKSVPDAETRSHSRVPSHPVSPTPPDCAAPLTSRAAMQLRIASANALSAIAKFTSSHRRNDKEDASDSDASNTSESPFQVPVRPFENVHLPPSLPKAADIALLRCAVPNDYFGTVLMCSEFVLAFWRLLLRFDHEEFSARVSRHVKREQFGAFSLVRLFADSERKRDADRTALREPLSIMIMLFVLNLFDDEQYGELTTFGIRLKQLEVASGNVCEILRFILLRTVRRYERYALYRKPSTSSSAPDGVDPEYGIRGHAVHDDELIEDEVSDDGRKLRSYVRLARILETAPSLDSLDVSTTLQLVDVLIHRLLLCSNVTEFPTTLQHELAESRQRYNAENERAKTCRDTLTKALAKLQELESSADASAAKSTPTPAPIPAPVSAPATASTSTSTSDTKSRAETRRVSKALGDAERQVAEAQRAMEAQRIRNNAALTRLVDARTVLSAATRTTWLGTDRHRRRYWLFTATTAPGLFVESERIDIDDEDDDDNDNQVSFGRNGASAIRSQWQVYDKVEMFRDLVAKLTDESEKELQTVLLSRSKSIEQSIATYAELTNDTSTTASTSATASASASTSTSASATAKQNEKSTNKDTVPKSTANKLEGDSNSNPFEMRFHAALYDFELRVRSHGLGGVPNFGAWSARLEQADDVKQLADCLITSYRAVLRSFLIAPFGRAAPHPGGVARTHAILGRMMNITQRVQLNDAIRSDWQRAVETANTEQRLHFLLSVLSAAVRWDKKVETSAACVTCKRRGDDANALLCDECNAAYHMYCLRPPLEAIPDGNWFCPTCAPSFAVNDKSDDGDATQSTSEAESGAESDESETLYDCEKCNGMPTRLNPTFTCRTCGLAYHARCENSLRRADNRRKWVCTKCRSRSGNKSRRTRGNLRGAC